MYYWPLVNLTGPKGPQSEQRNRKCHCFGARSKKKVKLKRKEKKYLPEPGFEPGTSCVAGRTLNPYTMEVLVSDPNYFLKFEQKPNLLIL